MATRFVLAASRCISEISGEASVVFVSNSIHSSIAYFIEKDPVTPVIIGVNEKVPSNYAFSGNVYRRF